MLGGAPPAKRSPDQDCLLDELSRSANPVIALYARLQKLLAAN